MPIKVLNILFLVVLFFTSSQIFGQDKISNKKSSSMELVYNFEGKSDVKVVLPLRGYVNIIIDWGDGSTPQAINYPMDIEHLFNNTFLDTIRITGSLDQLGKGYHSVLGVKYLRKILSFGNLGLKSLSGAFSEAKNLVQVPKSLPTTVKDLSYLFYRASSLNGDLSNWDVSNVTNMRGMFSYARSFTSDLSSWNVSNVTDIAWIFSDAFAFTSDLSSWNVSNVIDMSGAFRNASSFNGNISSWDVSNVEKMEKMFYGASSFTSDLSSWDVSKVTTMFAIFQDASSFISDLSSWNVSSVTDMRYMFSGASSFDSDLSSWNIGAATTLEYMFQDAISFNSNLNSWNIKNVKTMYAMFFGASSFNGDLSSWDISNVQDIRYMFSGASSFNCDLSSWDVSKISYTTSIFSGASSFNSDLSSWDVANVTDMASMFYGASSFNSDLSSWNVSNVENMNSMFSGASSFNSDLSSWDISMVTDMASMFYGASSFNSDLSSWDISKVSDISYMFRNASSFSSDLSSWNVSNVTDLSYMFAGASSFNSDLSSWDISNSSSMYKMLSKTSLTTKNYDKLLYGWSQLASLQSEIEFGAQDIKYSIFGKKYRDILVNEYKWHIQDSGISMEEQSPLIVDINPLSKDSIGLKINESLPIKIAAFDPENKPLSYKWKLNGSLLDTTSDSIIFKETSAGTYQLKVLAIDDKNLKDSVSWNIRVTANGLNISENTVKESTLFQNYPNPFNPVTNIRFYLASRGLVSLKVYNYRGEMVRELTNNMLKKGFHSFNFDGSLFSSGVYFYRLSGKGFSWQKKMILIK